MKILKNIIKQACVIPRSIVLAEGDDIRVIEAAARTTREGIANCVLVGDPETIGALADEAGISLEGIRIENPESSTRTPDYGAKPARSTR